MTAAVPCVGSLVLCLPLKSSLASWTKVLSMLSHNAGTSSQYLPRTASDMFTFSVSDN